MDVKRFDVITDSDSTETLFTVPSGKAYTVTGFTIVETEGNSGEITLKVGDTQVIGQFGISGPDTIYPISNVNLAASQSLKISSNISGVYITASIIERDV